MITTKTKSFLVLLVTLIIGMAIGFEISEILIKNKFAEIKAFREPKGFIFIFEDIIRPDTGQKPTVDSILLKYHRKMETVTQKGMNEVSLMMDSMKVELGKVLNEEQINRLDDEMQRMKRKPLPPNHGGPMPPDGRRPMPPPMDDGRPPHGPMP